LSWSVGRKGGYLWHNSSGTVCGEPNGADTGPELWC
jgi:hypothetical protein